MSNVRSSRSRLAFISSDNQARLAYRETEDNLYQLLFGQFKVDMGILRYDAIPVDKYDVAIAWIERKAAELLPSDLTMVAPRQETLL